LASKRRFLNDLHTSEHLSKIDFRHSLAGHSRTVRNSLQTTTAQPGIAEAIELQRQVGHSLYADHLSAMLYGNGPNPARS
jgi:hypothetical protein